MIGQRPQYVGSRHLSCAVFCQTVPFCTHVACLVRCQSSSRSFPFTFTLCSHTILMCPAQIHFWRHIFPKHLRLVQSRLSLTLLSILSRYFMHNIFLSIFVCVAARSVFTWLVNIQISVPCVIASAVDLSLQAGYEDVAVLGGCYPACRDSSSNLLVLCAARHAISANAKLEQTFHVILT